MEIFGIPLQAFLGQLLLGLVNGSFYAMLSLGLAVIFGLLGIVNFAHGALYMIGAFIAFGATLFYLRSAAPPSITTADIWWGSVTPTWLQLAALLLVWIFPALATWLPRLVFQ